ncbi:MAG: Alpha N-terminal protein methyltransferase 1 [Pycnora praestabilis]|nr:MAG: Alpha N-terminal protein methyltransferase 1 [Pycnora praestabilis]
MSSQTPTLPPDANIDHSKAIDYWQSISPDVNGMLGGYPQISRIDLQGSSNFLAKLKRQSPASPKVLQRGVDCGAGIGRVTLGFLSRVCEVVDLVEPVETFTKEVLEGPSFAALREGDKLGAVYVKGLEDWVPERKYDLVWNQWCVGHLTDAQLVAYLKRCRGALTEKGWVVVKENLSTDRDGEDIFDDVDNSVTRTDWKFRSLFKEAGLMIVKTELQTGFPKGLGLYPVRFYASQPMSP